MADAGPTASRGDVIEHDYYYPLITALDKLYTAQFLRGWSCLLGHFAQKSHPLIHCFIPKNKVDKDTFQNPEVAAYMNENFIMVKMDGEGKEPLDFNGKTFKYIPSGRRGYHELAAALLQGRLSYPTVVFLDEDMKMLSPVPGYQKVEPFLQIARYFGDDIYKTQDWKTYSGVGK